MNTACTPQNTRDDRETAAVAEGNVVMSPAQFEKLLATCRPHTPEVARAFPAAAEAAPTVGSVAVKLPTFWVHDPELWFLQAESVFNTRVPKVTRDATKFDHVVTALPPEALNSLVNVIRLPATVPDRYTQLKAALNLTYGKTQAEKLKELIEYAACKTPIMDVKPSNMLMHIKELAGDSKEAFERAVLLNRLPDPVRTTLSTSTAADNKAFALEANSVMEAFLQTDAAAAFRVSSITTEQDQPLVAAVDRQRSSQHSTPFLCTVHARYGSRAYSCRSPQCTMRGQVQRRPAAGNARAGRQ